MISVFHHSRLGKRLLSASLLAVLLASFVTGSLPTAYAQGAPALFENAGAVAAADMPASIARASYVNVDLGLLIDAQGQARSAQALPEVSLNLFPNANYTGLISRVTKDNFSTSWIGTLQGVPGGYFYLVVADGAFAAHIASTQGVYEVSAGANHRYKAVQIDQSKLVDEPPAWHPSSPGTLVSPADLGPNADTGARIDVMVVYTAAALAGAGGLANMKAAIALAMTETNTGYANAGVTPRLRLVHIAQVSYVESGNIQTDVNRLANSADGYMDNVHSMRNTYAADMVSLIVENGGGFCGIADAIMASAATAFDVTARNCMTGYYSFGHEFGHLQGARHDMYADPTLGLFPYGHGYVYLPARWRTVMAYNDLCAATSPFTNCTRLDYWSNDTKTYGGVAMGDSTLARNYQVLNNTAYTVANFRIQKIAENFNSTFNGSAAGWPAVSGVWALASSAYYTTVGIANRWSSIAHTGTYGDVTYQARMKRAGCSACSNSLIIRGNPASLRSDNMWRPGYLFEYTNGGAFSVWNEGPTGTATALKPWTMSAAIVHGGWNTLKVIAVGSSLKFYINGTLVWSGNSSAYATGRVGVMMYRDGVSTGNKLYVDWATLSTTPTADVNPNADIAPGIEVPGGTMNESP